MGRQESGQEHGRGLIKIKTGLSTIVQFNDQLEHIEPVKGEDNKKGQSKIHTGCSLRPFLCYCIISQLSDRRWFYLFLNFACAAANLAIGTRGGEQLT